MSLLSRGTFLARGVIRDVGNAMPGEMKLLGEICCRGFNVFFGDCIYEAADLFYMRKDQRRFWREDPSACGNRRDVL